MLSLILSDVPGDDLAMIASGPTVPSAATPEKAAAILEAYGLTERLPAAVVAAVTGHDNLPADSLPHARAILIGGKKLIDGFDSVELDDDGRFRRIRGYFGLLAIEG